MPRVCTQSNFVLPSGSFACRKLLALNAKCTPGKNETTLFFQGCGNVPKGYWNRIYLPLNKTQIKIMNCAEHAPRRPSTARLTWKVRGIIFQLVECRAGLKKYQKVRVFLSLATSSRENVACESKDCQVPSLDIVKVLQRRHCLTELKGCKHETEQLVEHWDSFLKALAQRVLSYSVGTGGYRTMQITSLAFACMCPSCCNFLHLGPWAF
jgi:hypothetical protein